jgi:hypothetical protein
MPDSEEEGIDNKMSRSHKKIAILKSLCFDWGLCINDVDYKKCGLGFIIV